MPQCVSCNLDKTPTHSLVFAGRYYKGICEDCKRLLLHSQQPSSGHARWQRSIDLEDHEADIQQPYNSDGSINSRFAKLYPKQAAALFNPKQIRDAELKG